MQYLALLAAEGQEHMTIALEEVAPIFKVEVSKTQDVCGDETELCKVMFEKRI